MGRRRNETSLEDIFWVFFGIFAIVIIFIKLFVKLIEWTIKGIIMTVASVEKIIEYFSNKSQKNNANFNESTKKIDDYNSTTLLPKPLKNYNVNYNEPIKYDKKLLRMPKYIISTPYDDKFSSIIRERGINYFKTDKVDNYKLIDQTCSADIKGTENYKTSITFYKNKNIKKAECSCPYFIKDNTYCKHIYALLLKYCKNENVAGFIDKLNYIEDNHTPKHNTANLYNKMISICNAMKEIIENTKEYYDNLDDTDLIEDVYNEIIDYEEKLNKYQNSKLTELNQSLINSAQSDLDDMRTLYDELEIEIEETDEEEYNDDYEFNEALVAGFVAHEMHKDYLKRKEQEEYENEREELKNTWGLFDHEIDEVQKGNYDPWNFEEEDLEEDDYYYGDDD